MGKVEDATAVVPVMARDITEIKSDVNEVKEDNRSIKRALYTTALSVVGGSILFAFTVSELFK